MSAIVGDEKTADRERGEHLRRLTHFASSYYVLPLFLFFAIADIIWYREFFWEFLGLRITTAVLAAAINRVTNRQEGSLRTAQFWSTAFISVCIWPLHAMYMQIADPGTPYYAGLILIVCGLGSFRFTWRYYFFNLAQAILPVLITGLWKGGYALSSYFLLNLCFLCSVSLILTVSRWFTEKLHDRELEVRQQLNNEIESRGEIIQAKTKEALRMQSLSKQFSPQIISSIRSGHLSLDGKIHRAEICAVFVDIVGSTDKFIRLDRDDLQKILKMYMDDVMGTFLKYDITIDKFLGDGVLAFSNDPEEQSDYVERVLRASVEIMAKIQGKQEEYNSYWLSEFQISFGISTGFASVGFYGSDLHVKSYTAIGRVVNLAARLGSHAGANEILVSQELLTKLKKASSPVLNELLFEDKGLVQLKGFDSEQIRIFAVSAKTAAASSGLTGQDADTCPHGHGLLYLAQDQNGIYFFKCRYCDYSLRDSSMDDSLAG